MQAFPWGKSGSVFQEAGHLWHTDFHHENIYVNPENPTEITGIIDWQSTPITPLFDQPLDLPFVKYDGPDIGGNLEIPMLPDDFQSMQDDEKKKVHKDYMDKSAVVAWRLLLKHKNPTYYRAVSSSIYHRGVFSSHCICRNGRRLARVCAQRARYESCPMPFQLSTGQDYRDS